MNDPHRLKAAEIFGVAYEVVTSEQRAYAKNVNYIWAYSAIETPHQRAKRELGFPIEGIEP